MAVATKQVVLDTAIRTNGLNLPLKDGSVVIGDRWRFNHIEVVPHIAAFRRMVRGLEFDVSDVAPVTYLLSKRFLKQFTAIPVFVTRNFHHDNVVFNPKSGIKEPKDLDGKRLGIRAYTVTANIWFTGMLQKEYGVDPSKITFVTDDEDHVQEYQLPPNVVKVPQGKSLAELWTEGELDAAFLANAGIGRAGAPVGDWAGSDAVKQASQVESVPLFPNPREAQLEWYRRTYPARPRRDRGAEFNPGSAPLDCARAVPRLYGGPPHLPGAADCGRSERDGRQRRRAAQ